MVLQIKGLRKSYCGVEILKGIDMAVSKGETVAVMGPSGCGKSTLLRCITRITEPDAGDIYFNGRSLIDLNDKDLRIARRKIGFVFQGHNLIERMTALENVALGLIVSGTRVQEARDLSIHALDRVGLIHKGSAFPNELSGGERQRVGIARALVMCPDIILWDEPTASLDPMLVSEIHDLMRELAARERIAMVIVTHEVIFAVSIANRLLLMERGMIVEEGIPSEIMSNPVSQLGYTLSETIQPRRQNWHLSGERRYIFPGKYFVASSKPVISSGKATLRHSRSPAL